MNQNVNPVTAVVIILVAVLLLSLIFWARQESLRVGGPDQIQIDTEGNVYIHISGSLYKLNSSLETLSEYSLSELGIYDLVGDFAFFSNGDVLLRRGVFEPGIMESVVRYLRKPDPTPPIAKMENEGLYRCTLDLKECKPFGSNGLDFDSAFHLSIDTTSDTVYVSDTGRHKLRKYDAEGNELATKADGYKFPNQNILFNNTLFIADTNHHAIQVAETNTENFGNILETHSILDSSLGRDIWPFSLAKVNKQWWVNNMDNTMSHGTIAIYDENWKFVNTIELPANADPIDLAVLNDRVLVTDLDNLNIYQLDHDGHLLTGPLPRELTSKLEEIKEEQRFYNDISIGIMILFVLFILGGFVIAIRQVLAQKDPAINDTHESLHINLNDPNIRWIEKDKDKVRLLKIAMLIPLLAILLFPLLIQYTQEDFSLTPFIFAATILLVLPVMTYKLFSMGIGTLGDVLVLKKSEKEFSAGLSKDIYYSDTHILIGKIYMPFNRQQLFFDTEQVIKEIMPLLRNANYVKPRQMMNMILKRQKPTTIAPILVLVIVFLGVMFGSIYL